MSSHSDRAAICAAVTPFERAKPSARLGRWRAALATLLLALPLSALAIDLQITDFSDTGYDPVPAGTTVIYNVKVENGANDSAAGSVTIIDLPVGTALGSPAPAGCSASPGTAGTTRVACTNPTLSASGAPYQFKLPVTTVQTQPATITLHAAIGFAAALPPATTPIVALQSNDPFFAGDTNTGNNRSNQTTTIQAAADLELSKSASPDPVIGGGEVTYTLTVKNNGPSVSTGFRVVDTLPPNVTLVGTPSGADWSFSAQNGTYNGTLAVGASTSYQFRGKVNVGTGNIVNAAVVNAGPVPDAVPDNNAAQVTTAVTAGADLAISKSVSPAPAAAGSVVTYTLTARNDGPSAATGVVVTDAMPEGFVITGGVVPAGWTCTSSAGASVRTCSLAGSFAPGAQAIITITAQVPSTGTNSSGVVSNTARISATTPDPAPINNSGTVGLTIIPDGADLLMSKSKSPLLVPVWNDTGVRSDSMMSSTLGVQNLGPRTVTGDLQVVDTLAVGEQWVDNTGQPILPGTSVVIGRWNCSVDRAWAVGQAQRVTCTLITGYPVAVNANAPSLVLQTLARTAGMLRNNVCTGGSGGSVEPTTGGGINRDPNDTNDCAGGESRATDDRADLSITKVTNGPGDTDNIIRNSDDSVTYTLQIRNAGEATTGVVVNDPIPGFVNGTTTVTANISPMGWNCRLSGSACGNHGAGPQRDRDRALHRQPWPVRQPEPAGHRLWWAAAAAGPLLQHGRCAHQPGHRRRARRDRPEQQHRLGLGPDRSGRQYRHHPQGHHLGCAGPCRRQHHVPHHLPEQGPVVGAWRGLQRRVHAARQRCRLRAALRPAHRFGRGRQGLPGDHERPVDQLRTGARRHLVVQHRRRTGHAAPDLYAQGHGQQLH